MVHIAKWTLRVIKEGYEPVGAKQICWVLTQKIENKGLLGDGVQKQTNKG